MTIFSCNQAINILNNLSIYPEYQGVSGLTQLLADTSIKVPGASADAISLFYSGMIGDLHSSELATEISAGSGGRVITINQTGQGQLLQSEDFKSALRQAVGIDEANALINGGTLPDGTATRGLWDTVVSKNFALDAQSAISLTPNSSPDSIWARTEGPILIERGVSVNSIPGDVLKQIGVADGLNELNFTSENLLENVRYVVGSDGQVLGVDPGNLFSSTEGSLRGYSINSLPEQLPTGASIRTGLQLMTPAPGSTPVVASAGDPFVNEGDTGYLTSENAEALRQGAKTYAANMPPEWLGKGLSVLGTAGLAASFIWTADKANQQAQNGQPDEARDTMLVWMAETEGALLAGGQVAELAAPLLAGGPAGWAAYGALVLVGGVAGGLIGKSAMDQLLDANLEQAPAASQQVTHSDGSVWELTLYSNGATRESLLTQPPGEVVVYAYSSKWTMPQDGSGNYATVEVGERASDMRISNYSTVDGQPVLQNRANTWIDDSGVAQMQMYNEQGQLISATTDEAINAGGDTETRTGYVDGSQVNQQIKNTNADNEVSDFISGSGANINLDNASITFADGASASLTGLGNMVSDAANNSLEIAKADGLSVSSNGQTLTALGSSLSVSITGENNTAVIDGEYNTLAVNGNGNYEMISGNNNYTAVSGSNNNTAVSGSNNNTTAAGSSNTTAVYGSYDTTKSLGIGDFTQASGDYNQTVSYGNYDTTIANGSSNTTMSHGTGDNTQASGVGNDTHSYGNNDTTIANGSSNTTKSHGTGDNTQVSGDANNTQSVGDYDTTLAGGSSNTTLSWGTGDYTQSTGVANDTQSSGNYETTISNGSSNTALSYGAGSYIQSYGSDNNIQSFGSYSSIYAYSDYQSPPPADTPSNVPVDLGVVTVEYTVNGAGEVVVSSWSNYSSIWDALFGDWGFAGNKTHIDELIGGAQSSLAQYQSQQGKTAEALLSQQAFDCLKQTLTANTGKAVYEDAHFNQKTITWSLANQGSAFSRFMGNAEEAAINQAFATWSEVSGLHFQEVEDSSQANICLGWGDFNTTETGVIGLTTLGASHDRMKQQAIIRLEDNQQLALSANQDGDLIYDNTEATFSQVLLHEIGHSLGLADSTDQNSIEYYYLGKENRTLSQGDVNAIRALYNPTSESIERDTQQLIQAMAGFGVPTAAQTQLLSANNEMIRQPLLAVPNV